MTRSQANQLDLGDGKNFTKNISEDYGNTQDKIFHLQMEKKS